MQWPSVPIRVGAVAVVATVALAGCSGGKKSNGDSTQLSSGPISLAAADPTGVMKTLVDRWNVTHPGETVTITALPVDPAARRDQLVENLQNHAAGYDVVATDLSSTAEFASQRWIVPLTGALAVDTSGTVKPAVAAGTWAGSVYAAPVTAETGLLYYRTDLIKSPPSTWATLTADCAVAAKSSMACYSGQYAQGPDLSTNALEAIYAAGGQVLSADGKKAAIDDDAARKGLQFLVDSYHANVIPAAAITYQREQSVRAFGSSALVMLRAEADSYAALNARSSPVTGKVGVAALPGPSGPATPMFTGVGASIDSAGAHRRTALEFVRFLQSPDAQKRLLTDASLPPALTSIYQDVTLRSTYPFLDVLRTDWATGVPAPVTPQYQAISDALADGAYSALTGASTVAQVTKSLQATIGALPLG